MLVLNYRRSFSALEHFVHHYNDQQEVLSAQVRLSMLGTAKEIIRIYGAYLAKLAKTQKIDPENLPSFPTNNAQLSRRVSCKRTIQRHLIRLQEAGILTGKKWHGTNAPFELWINPQVVWINPSCRPVTPKDDNDQKGPKKAIKGTYEKDLSTKCHHTDHGNNGYTNKTIVKPVETGDNSQSTGNEIWSSHPLTVDEQGYTYGNSKGYTKKEATPAFHAKGDRRSLDMHDTKKEARPITVVNEAARTTPGLVGDRAASLSMYTDLLWKLAKNHLYQDKYLTPGEEQRGRERIKDWYAPVATDQLERVHGVYCTRIGMVRKYIQKDPKNRFVLLPSAFFDTQNEKGFRITKAWYDQKHQQNQEQAAERILTRTINAYRENSRKPTAEQIPPMKMLSQCQQRLQALGKQGILERFHMAILPKAVADQIAQISQEIQRS